MLIAEQKILGAIVIDLENELKFMAQEYGLSEKQVLNWWRTSVRQMWANSPFLDKLRKEATYKVINENTRNMKRFPEVARIDCVKCKKAFSPSDMNLDHIEGDNKAESLADAEKFMKSILFTPRSNLQWLCDDLQRTRNKKKVTVSIGCHSIKSQVESDPTLTGKEAWVIREFGRIKKYENVLDKLMEYNVQSIPKLKKDQESLLRELLLENINSDKQTKN